MSTVTTIQVFKLVNGDEIIGEVIHQPEVHTAWTIRRPLKVSIIRNPSTGQPGKVLLDWFLLIPDVEEVKLYTTSVLCEPLQASKELADVWLEQTSGLILATAGQLNG